MRPESLKATSAQRHAAFVNSRRLEMIKLTLHEDEPEWRIEQHLGHLGTTLAEADPKRYNNLQVAKDSDGRKKLDNVA